MFLLMLYGCIRLFHESNVFISLSLFIFQFLSYTKKKSSSTVAVRAFLNFPKIMGQFETVSARLNTSPKTEFNISTISIHVFLPHNICLISYHLA